MKNETVLSVTTKDDGKIDFEEFLEVVKAVNNRFKFSLINAPEYHFRDEIVEYIVTNGLASFYEQSLILESVLAPSTPVNELDKVLKKFVETLQGASRLIIVDPYLYASRNDVSQVSTRFAKMIGWIGSNLTEIKTFTNGNNFSKGDLQSAVKGGNATIAFDDFTCGDLHDRFWIDPDANQGVVFGTSLNGLGKKLVLVDKLQEDDVTDILDYLKTNYSFA